MTSPDRINQTLDLLELAQRTGDQELLDRVVAGLREIADELAPGHPYRAAVLVNLGEALRQRYETRGNRDDLDAAIAAQQDAMALMPAPDRRRPAVLRSLSVLLQNRVEQYGGAGAGDDLRTAERLAAAAVDESGPADPMWPSRRHALAAAQRLRYDFDGAQSHLADAIATARRASAAEPGSAVLASHLGLLLRRQYERTGSLSDLNEAIDIGRSAAIVDDKSSGPMIWTNLSTMLEARFTRLGDSSDLDEAIAVVRQAVDLTTDEYIHHGMFLSALARILQIRGTEADLAEAEQAAERAVDATSPDSARQPARSALLALSLLDQGTPAAIDRAITVSGRAALDTLGLEHPDAQVVYVAARALAARPEGRAQAIRYAQLALDLTRPDDPARASIELSLGDWAQTEPVGHYRRAALQRSAAPSVRCDAARRWAGAAGDMGDLEEATKAFEHAVELLPMTASRGLGRADRERQLERRTGLAGDAAATALQRNDPGLALRLLEQGRGVLISQLLDTRSDFAALRRRDPALADRLTGLAALLDGSRLER
jgi:tetratricopeptide (TPR) repeat protein